MKTVVYAIYSASAAYYGAGTVGFVVNTGMIPTTQAMQRMLLSMATYLLYSNRHAFA